MKRAHRKNKPKVDAHSLPDAELEVLACLWRTGEATAREVREMMNGFRPMAHGSIATLLARLQEKGLVTREKAPVGKAFVYRPVRRAAAGYRSILSNLLDRVFGGSSIALVTSLFETKPPTREELQQLEKLLDDLRNKRK
jgi:predicted transcriptional regulator